jgi:hypothetical protein
MNTIIVNKGLHPENYTLIEDIQRNLNNSEGWFTLGITSLAMENKDLDMVVHTNHNYIDQGMFSVFDAFKYVNEDQNVSVNFKSYVNNGVENPQVDDVTFSYNDDDSEIVIECVRTADDIFQTLKTVVMVYRAGNKRTITLTNIPV